MYRLTGSDNDRDRVFLAEVVRVGTGEVFRGHPEVFVAAEGDIILANLSNVDYRVHLQGQAYWLLQNKSVAATLNRETWKVTPAQHYTLVRPDPEAAHMATTGGTLIRLSEGDASATDHVRAGLKSEWGRVIACGPGRHFDGEWLAPPCKPGDLILYDRSHSTLPLLVRGDSETLVAAHQVLYVEPAEDAVPATLPDASRASA